MIDKDELLFVVDGNDNPLEPKPRKEVHAKKYWHRVSHIFVKNPSNQILCHQRSMLKDSNPGKWNVVFGGHLAPGEDYLTGAINELYEEASIKADSFDLKLLEIYKMTEAAEFQAVYLLEWDGAIEDLHFEKEEIDQLKWIEISKLQKLISVQDPNWSFMGYEENSFKFMEAI
jgi:isopentenyl-diphosphate delta-isomerase